MLSPSSPAVMLVGSCFCGPPWLGAVPCLPLCNTFSYSYTCFWLLLVCCWKMSIFTLYCSSSRATPLEETRTRWLSAQSYCSYGNRPNRHEWCAPNCSVRIKQEKKERNVNEAESCHIKLLFWTFHVSALKAFRWAELLSDILFTLASICRMKLWEQPTDWGGECK